MFWKIALVLGIFGLMVGLILSVYAGYAFYTWTDEITNDIPFAGFLIGIILVILSFLLTAISAIFVLRNSKKEWDAQNPK